MVDEVSTPPALRLALSAVSPPNFLVDPLLVRPSVKGDGSPEK